MNVIPDAKVKSYKFVGMTAFVIVADKLGYLTEVGDWLTPGEAIVPVEDASTFKDLLTEAKIPFSFYAQY